MSTDARYRTKLWLETYDTPANITKDDDTTAASIIYQFEKPPYPLKRVFYDPKNVDGIITIGTPNSVAVEDWKNEAYAYIETVPIELSCVTKQGITGDKLRWKMELDLRNIIETYPLGSVRRLSRASPQDKDMGLWKLHTVKYDLEYKRAAEDYTSDVTLSYGSGWEYDGLRLAGGAEGTWTYNAAGSTGSHSVTSNPGTLTVAVTVFVGDAYTETKTAGTNLTLSPALYPRIRFRYKTTGTAKAKVIIMDNGDVPQTVLAETASTTWSVVDVAITLAANVDHIYVYCCDATGSVQVDWIEIYAGNFTFPNVTDIRFTPSSRNINLGIPSGMVLGTQNLGADPARIEIDCDTDMETTTYAWKRSASDKENIDIFLDIMHNQSIDAPWQYLVWGRNSTTPFAWKRAMRVNIDDIPTRNRDGTCTVNMQEYSESNMNASFGERWNT